MKATLQTIAILLGVAVAVVARVTERPSLIWLAIGLMVVGFSIRFIRMGR